MKFSIISDAFQQMEATTKRLELTDILVKLIQEIPEDVIAKAIYLIQGKLRPNFEGVELGIAEKLVMRAMSKSSGIPLKKIEDDYNKGGDLGQTAENILQQKIQTTFASEVITLEKVYDTLFKISKLEGKGSQEMKMKYVSSMLNDATPQESKFILKILLGTLRLGIAENTVMDALAIAFTGKKENREIIENAYNVSSDLGKVAEVISTGGVEEIEKFQIKLFSPIRPMLADRIKSGEETVEKFQEKFAAEYKLDGERAQIHKQKDKIEIFSRSLEIITSYYPDIVEKISKLIISEDVILEAEVVAMNSNSGDFLPFQELMHRRRKYKIEQAVKNYPISVNLFDIIYLDNQDLTNSSYEKRRKILSKIIEKNKKLKIIKNKITQDAIEIDDFLEQAIEEGCEGLVIKDIQGNYRAGAREYLWIKLKREYTSEMSDTLDLVIIGAMYGKGKRANKYGALLLAVYDKRQDVFRSFCKVGTGFSDEQLQTIYEILQKNIIKNKHVRVDSKMDMDVWFEPEIVLEVSGSEITISPIHTSNKNEIRKNFGLALRFPIFTGRIREDKKPQDITTTAEIMNEYEKQLKKVSN